MRPSDFSARRKRKLQRRWGRECRENAFIHYEDASGLVGNLSSTDFEFVSSSTGIGLAFCGDTLTAWGASIACRSEDGIYAEFIIQLFRKQKQVWHLNDLSTGRFRQDFCRYDGMHFFASHTILFQQESLPWISPSLQSNTE